jgi:hypothetical protein
MNRRKLFRIIMIIIVGVILLVTTYLSSLSSNLQNGKSKSDKDNYSMEIMPNSTVPIVISPKDINLFEQNKHSFKWGFFNPEASKERWIIRVIDNSGKECGIGTAIADCTGNYVRAEYINKPFIIAANHTLISEIRFMPIKGYLDSLSDPSHESVTSTTILYYIKICSVANESAQECELNAKIFKKGLYLTIHR